MDLVLTSVNTGFTGVSMYRVTRGLVRSDRISSPGRDSITQSCKKFKRFFFQSLNPPITRKKMERERERDGRGKKQKRRGFKKKIGFNSN